MIFILYVPKLGNLEIGEQIKIKIYIQTSQVLKKKIFLLIKFKFFIKIDNEFFKNHSLRIEVYDNSSYSNFYKVYCFFFDKY